MKNKITVLHLIDSLPREGAEMVIYDLIQQGDRDGFEILVCALTRGGGIAEMLEGIGVPVLILGRTSAYDLKAFRRFISLIKERQVDIIHTHLFSSHLWGGLAAILFPGRVLFRTEHNMSEWKNIPRRVIDKLLSWRTDQIVAVSEPVRGSLATRCRIPLRKVWTIENGINIDRLKGGGNPSGKLSELAIPPESRLIGCSAALTPKKGHKYLLDAAEIVLAKREDVYFLLLGDGELREELSSSIKDRGLAGRVLLLGSRSDAVEIVALLDIFVLSSIREGLSIALLEAMALGRAVVVTGVGGSIDLIRDGISGFLVPPRDGPALAEAMGRVLDDPKLKERLGRAAAEDVLAGYKMENMVMEYARLYRMTYEAKRR